MTPAPACWAIQKALNIYRVFIELFNFSFFSITGQGIDFVQLLKDLLSCPVSRVTRPMAGKLALAVSKR